MTVKAAEASGPTLTYSKMRGMVAILIGERRRDLASSKMLKGLWFFCQGGLTILFLLFLYSIAFMKQRRMGLNDFIQKIATNSYACKQ